MRLYPQFKSYPIPFLAALLLSPISALGQQGIDAMIDRDLPSLVATYKQLHQAPELSHYEARTSQFLAGELRKLGYTVTERVGKYSRPELTSYGLVAVLANGNGPTVLMRTEMDALPVEEKTGLPYASSAKMKNDAGQEVSVMHACGHDIHMTTLLGTAQVLSAMKSQWRGTLVLVGQPSEETVEGARAMLADDFYQRIPKPDFIIALHDSADLEAGKFGYTPGYAFSSTNTVTIKVRGVGGHGARPEAAKDPIVLAAQIVLALQTIVSRENSPLDPAVITVGSIQGGTKANVIPDEVTLLVTVRAYKEEVRQRMLRSIERITRGLAEAAGVPADRAPVVTVSDTEAAPALYNDPVLTERLARVAEAALGADNVVKLGPVMVSEDFGRFSLDQTIPLTDFMLGAVDPQALKQSRATGTPLPTLHSARFAPIPEPTIRTGVKAMSSIVLDLMKP